MSFALFRRFADRDELVMGADGQNVVIGPALRHRKCNELLALCGFDESEGGRGVANRCVANQVELALHCACNACIALQDSYESFALL